MTHELSVKFKQELCHCRGCKTTRNLLNGFTMPCIFDKMPELQSVWYGKTRDGYNKYTVLGITNLAYLNSKKPPQVVYVDANGALWNKDLSSWYNRTLITENEYKWIKVNATRAG